VPFYFGVLLHFFEIAVLCTAFTKGKLSAVLNELERSVDVFAHCYVTTTSRRD
jgi:hypothetical protein